MTYKLWHSGVLIGESDLDQPGLHRRQRAGAFRPTDYGRVLFPRLTGMLTAGAALKRELEARGLDPEAASRDQAMEIFETTDAGRKIVDIGRALSDVEIRDAGGKPKPFKTIAFIDMAELREVTREEGGEGPMALLPDIPPAAQQLIVSVTFA